MRPEIAARVAQIRRGEVPDGYKRTKAGIMPDDWEYCQLETFCHMKSGDGITSASIYPTGPYPCYGGNGLRGYTNTFTHSGQYVLIGRVGALCGNVLLADGTFFASEHAIVTQCNQRADEGFCYYLLDYMNLNRYSEASAQPVLAVQKLLKLNACLPPLTEQRKIAAVLAAQDRLIELKTRLIAEKTRQKKYLIQQLLTGKRRLPGFDGPWKTVALRDISAYSNAHTTGERKHYVSAENMRSHYGGVVFAETSDEPVSGIAYRKGDTLVGNIRPYLQKVWRADRDGVCSADTLVLRSSRMESRYFYCLIARDSFFDYVMGASKGTKMPRGDKKHIMDMSLEVPVSAAEQAAIADILTAADREIELLRQELDLQKRRKTALSQLLLTGLARLS